jgi:hypothetical protein
MKSKDKYMKELYLYAHMGMPGQTYIFQAGEMANTLNLRLFQRRFTTGKV